MDRSDRNGDRLDRVRRWMFWVLVLGFIGTEAELLLLEHYDDPWQFVPLLLMVLGFAALLWHTKRRHTASLRAFRAVMMLFILAGFIGLVLHFRGAVEFDSRQIQPWANGSW